MTDKDIRMDTRKSDASHQNNGRTILKAFQRCSRFSHPSQVQNTRALRAERVKGRYQGMCEISGLAAQAHYRSLLPAFQRSTLQSPFLRVYAVGFGGIQLELTL